MSFTEGRNLQKFINWALTTERLKVKKLHYEEREKKILFCHDYVGKIHQETEQASVILLNK